MLVLSRKEGESIRLGDSIVLTMIRIGSDKVRIGIKAPSDVLVLREELEPFEKAREPLPIVPLPAVTVPGRMAA